MVTRGRVPRLLKKGVGRGGQSARSPCGGGRAGEGRPALAYLAADGLQPVQPVQRLLGVAQVLLQLGVEDPHGEGHHGACNQSQSRLAVRCPRPRTRPGTGPFRFPVKTARRGLQLSVRLTRGPRPPGRGRRRSAAGGGRASEHGFVCVCSRSPVPASLPRPRLRPSGVRCPWRHRALVQQRSGTAGLDSRQEMGRPLFPPLRLIRVGTTDQ